MTLDAIGSLLRAATTAPISSDPAERIQATAQVRVLRKLLDAQSEMTSTLLATVGHVGRNLDVRA